MWAGTDAAGHFKLFQYKAIFGLSDAPGDTVSVVSEMYSSITSLAIAQSYLHAVQCRWGLSATNGVLSASLWTIPSLPATHVLLSFFDTVAADSETQITNQHLLGGVATNELGVSYLFYFDLLNRYIWRVPRAGSLAVIRASGTSVIAAPGLLQFMAAPPTLCGIDMVSYNGAPCSPVHCRIAQVSAAYPKSTRFM